MFPFHLGYRKYNVMLENGYTLHPSFKSRVQKIAADLMLNRSRLATYESQLLHRRERVTVSRFSDTV
jgi:hypothetical protein